MVEIFLGAVLTLLSMPLGAASLTPSEIINADFDELQRTNNPPFFEDAYVRVVPTVPAPIWDDDGHYQASARHIERRHVAIVHRHRRRG